ncbi:hypothetical protein SALB1_2941 [Salinisphaera sp. LB1]|nr:hypothetical protein SALB1_2941 [Salinisphaera sp. LB1]
MQAAIIYANEDLIEVIEWFREWKREQRLISATLVCYPLKISKRSLSGKPVSVAYISRRFTAAARAAGLDGYTLNDMRPKALTDEYLYLEGGDTDKGGHMTEAMKEHYRRVELPMRARSNLRAIKAESDRWFSGNFRSVFLYTPNQATQDTN